MRWFLIRAAGRAGGRVDGAPTTKGLHSGAHGAAEEGGDLAGVPAAAVMGLDRAQAGLTGSPASGFGGGGGSESGAGIRVGGGGRKRPGLKTTADNTGRGVREKKRRSWPDACAKVAPTRCEVGSGTE